MRVIVHMCENESSTLDPSGVLVLFLIYGLGYMWRMEKHIGGGDVHLEYVVHLLNSLQFLSSDISVHTTSYRKGPMAADLLRKIRYDFSLTGSIHPPATLIILAPPIPSWPQPPHTSLSHKCVSSSKLS